MKPSTHPSMEDKEDRNIGEDDDLDMIWSPPHLPDEIVEEILVRLPVKSLLRFKRVSKPWYALISDPQFSKSHIDRANTNKGHNFSLERYGFLCFETKPSPSLSLVISSNNSMIKLKKQLCNPFKKHQAAACNDEVQLLGSCNGLLFVSVAASDENFLWNPSTGETKLISSRSEFLSSFHFKNLHRISGLGYDLNSNNYKAIIAFRTKPSLSTRPMCGVPEQIAVSVCNSNSKSGAGASSIKYYHDFPYSFFMANPKIPGVTVNGTPHWVVSHLSEDYGYGSPNKTIICFDMAEESFMEVSRPDSLTVSSDFNVAVMMGGLLCVADTIFNGLDVWAMKEYGVRESWTKLFTISTSNSYQSFLNPLGFINIGEVLIHIGNNLVICNLETGKEDIIFSPQCGICAVAYSESLVSPNGHGHLNLMRKCISGGYK